MIIPSAFVFCGDISLGIAFARIKVEPIIKIIALISAPSKENLP